MLQFHQNDWDWQLLIPYFEYKYHKKIRPVARRKECDISPDCTCPSCHAPQPFLYRNNGSKGQLKCKVCDTNFSTDDNRFSKHYTLRCPHCGHALVHKKDRKHFILHKCVNQKCPYYLHNLKNVDKEHLEKDYGKNEYKLHYLIANYCKSAAICIKPFVDNYDYGAGTTFTADETYIKVRGIKSYIWFIMDAAKRSIIGYRVSDNRGVGPCIMAMRMAFRHFKELPKNFRFIADGYSAYPLAAQQFFHEFGDAFKFHITQVIGLTNDDAVSKEFRPFKQMIEPTIL
nr:DDE-type integrase/transposase/recombinase [Enterocloster clostridioformis]